VIEKCTAFISPMMQVGGGQKNMHSSFVIVEHMWNPLATNFSSSQAVGEDMVNTCWTDSDLCNSCQTWNTPHMFKDRFYLFPKVVINHWCWGSIAKNVVSLFPAILNGTDPSVNSFISRSTRFRQYYTWNTTQEILTKWKSFSKSKCSIMKQNLFHTSKSEHLAK
jgi:hypothetical protein